MLHYKFRQRTSLGTSAGSGSFSIPGNEVRNYPNCPSTRGRRDSQVVHAPRLVRAGLSWVVTSWGARIDSVGLQRYLSGTRPRRSPPALVSRHDPAVSGVMTPSMGRTECERLNRCDIEYMKKMFLRRGFSRKFRARYPRLPWYILLSLGTFQHLQFP